MLCADGIGREMRYVTCALIRGPLLLISGLGRSPYRPYRPHAIAKPKARQPSAVPRVPAVRLLAKGNAATAVSLCTTSVTVIIKFLPRSPVCVSDCGVFPNTSQKPHT